MNLVGPTCWSAAVYTCQPRPRSSAALPGSWAEIAAGGGPLVLSMNRRGGLPAARPNRRLVSCRSGQHSIIVRRGFMIGKHPSGSSRILLTTGIHPAWMVLQHCLGVLHRAGTICNLPGAICNDPRSSATSPDGRAMLPGREEMPSAASATMPGDEEGLPNAPGLMQDAGGRMQIVRETMQIVPARCRSVEERCRTLRKCCNSTMCRRLAVAAWLFAGKRRTATGSRRFELSSRS